MRRSAAILAFALLLLPTSTAGAAAPAEFPAGDEAFHTYAEVKQELRAIAAAHPDTTQLVSIGKSHEGRKLWMLKISDHAATDEAEPEVLLTGLMHAREHLTVEMTLAIIHWLVDDTATAEAQAIVNATEIWVAPMMNPDGGQFDIRHGRYHNWRKNRQPTPDSGSIGTDLNRNFAFHWGCCGGSSANPTAITYRGPAPFSTPEATAYRDFVRSRRIDGVQQLRLAINFHSYGREVLYPFGYTKQTVTKDMTPDDHQAVVALANGIADRNGYRAMQGSDLYTSSGGAGDWLYGREGVFGFTIELGPTTEGDGGFYPSADRISELTEENHAAVIWFLQQAACPYAAAGLTADC